MQVAEWQLLTVTIKKEKAMNVRAFLFRALLALCLMPMAHEALAGTTCAYGRQDNTCIGRVNQAPQAAPTCSTAAGWTTIAAATWIGSTYSSPQCNYTPPPTCPTGYTENSPPSWNGTSWVGLGCTVPPQDPPDPVSMCTATTPSGYALTQYGGSESSNTTTNHWAQLAGLTSYQDNTVYYWSANGPVYDVPCPGVQSNNTYTFLCFVHPDGSLNGATMTHVVPSSGQCNH